MSRPADFAEFWNRAKADLSAVPVEWERLSSPDAAVPGWRVEWVKFRSLHAQVVYGWLAVPEDTSAAGRPGYLWLPGYSLGNPPPGPESLYPGVVTFGLNLHGNLPNTPYVHPYQQNEEYVTRGIEAPETYIFRTVLCHCLRALEVLAEQPEVDPGRLIVGGMSQGGGLALATSGLAPSTVRLCFADMPWLCNLPLALSLIDPSKYTGGRRVPDSRYLVQQYADRHADRRKQIFRSYAYCDPLWHADSIQCPVQVSAGGRDPSCRPATITTVYDLIRSRKEMLFLPQTGHEIVPAMHDAHEKWVNECL